MHECNLNCHSMEPSKLESLGIDDVGKWIPFIFHIDIVESAKLTSDEQDLPTYGCTTIFTKYGEAYIIDTPYREFFDLLKEYHLPMFDEGHDDDLTL